MYHFQSRVRYSETGRDEKLTLQALVDYFQDCSTFQSEDLGLGVSYLQKQDMVWVLSAWQIVVEEYPPLGQEIEIGTFPYAFRGFMGFRNFFMRDKNNGRYAYANSVWTLLNTKTFQPVRPTREMLEGYALEKKLDMEYAPRKIALPQELGMGRREPFTVRRHQIDSNGHVNNSQYVKMAAEYLPENRTVRQLRAEYKMQAYYGDELYPFTVCADNVCTVALCGQEGNPYSVMEFLLGV